MFSSPPPPQYKTHTRWAHSSNHSSLRREPKIIVLHSTEGHEGIGSTDLNVAAMLAKPNHGTSFHYVVDGDSITQCVPEMLIAWHAGRTANRLGLGVELCGRANQTAEQWRDEASQRTLDVAAWLVARLCLDHRIPVRVLTAEDLKRDRDLPPRGITTHAACSQAWNESTHWDPGPGFPLDEFCAAVSAALTNMRATT